MKKSEKMKGKEAAAARKKSYMTVWDCPCRGHYRDRCRRDILFLRTARSQKPGTLSGFTIPGNLTTAQCSTQTLNGTPLEFTLGSGQMIPGFEEAVTGMAVGDEKTVVLPVDKAYGPYHPELVVTINRSANLSVTNPLHR